MDGNAAEWWSEQGGLQICEGTREGLIPPRFVIEMTFVASYGDGQSPICALMISLRNLTSQIGGQVAGMHSEKLPIDHFPQNCSLHL
jgi:hypothetical protein